MSKNEIPMLTINCNVLDSALKNNIKPLLIKEMFINENSSLKIDSHPTDANFLIIRNCDFKQGLELCEKYGASGWIVGKKRKDFKIGNFGQY